MSSKLLKKNKDKKTQENQDTFSIKKMEEGGKVFLLRFKNNLWKYADSNKYPFQIGIAIPLQTNQNGFPTKEENQQLLIMEQELEKKFARKQIAVFAGAIMGGGMKELVFYTGKPNKAKEIYEMFRGKIKHHELQGMVRKDPDWEVYKTYGPKRKK